MLIGTHVLLYMKEMYAGTFWKVKVHLAILKRICSAVRAGSVEGMDRCTQAKKNCGEGLYKRQEWQFHLQLSK